MNIDKVLADISKRQKKTQLNIDGFKKGCVLTLNTKPYEGYAYEISHVKR